MSWGIRIAIVYIGFVILISTLVLISSNNKSELVTKDYYAQELKYQDRINALNNEKDLKVSIQYKITPNEIVLSFPKSEINNSFSGEVLFFRPSDASKDLKLNLRFNSEGKQIIQKLKFTKGIYKMCITWKNDNRTFYKEQIINI